MSRHTPSKPRPGWQDERRLLTLVKNEDEKALDRFTRDHGAGLYRLAFRLVGDEERALQIFTSALVQALQRSCFRNEDQELGPWLAGFILRRAMPVPPRIPGAATAPDAGDDSGQKRGRGGRGKQGRGRGGRSTKGKAAAASQASAQEVTGPTPVVDWSPLVENEDSRRELRQRLQQEAARLPFDLRSAWVMLDAEGRHLDQSAAAMELDRATALSRLHRARMRLCTALAPGDAPRETS
jgi:DNA-directed RNA polymerase specialized sigma24 family protein